MELLKTLKLKLISKAIKPCQLLRANIWFLGTVRKRELLDHLLHRSIIIESIVLCGEELVIVKLKVILLQTIKIIFTKMKLNRTVLMLIK